MVPWLPTSYRRSLSNKKKKTENTVPPLPPQFGVLCFLGCYRTGTKCSPCAAEGTLRSAACRVQASAPSAGGAAWHFSSLLTREEAEHISKKEGKQGSLTCLPPVSSPITGSSTHCTHKPDSCALVLASGSSLPQRMQRERSKRRLPSWSHLSCHSTPSCLLWDPAPTGLLATEAGSFPTDTSGPVPLAERFGTPLRPCPWGLRTLGSCPCAPYPGHHPGSAGPEEESASQIQVLLAREVFLSDLQALLLWEVFTNP